MAIDLEKILTMSADEYCKMYGKNLSDYEAKGVHLDTDNLREGLKIIDAFRYHIPKDTEVVVGYRAFASSYERGIVGSDFLVVADGTALIPKKR